MHVAACQLDCAWEDKHANFMRVRALAASAKLPAGSLFILPEMFATGFSQEASIVEREGGETEAFLSGLAKDLGLTVLGGRVASAVDGRGRNLAEAFGPDGKRIARYAKIHPFTFGGEDRLCEAGREIVTFPWGGFSVAPFVCYDLRFPEIFRFGVLRGAQLFVVIASWPDKREGHWTSLLQARAIENQAYVVGVNRCGKDPKHRYPGRSMIVDPRGKVLADGGKDEGLVRADLEVQTVETYRRELPFLQDMRAGFE